MPPNVLSPLSEEFSSVALGDARRKRRLMTIVDSAARAVGESLPVQAGGDLAALEGTYRLLNSDHIAPESILAAHQECTAGRALAAGTVVVAHDTTQFEFQGETSRQGLGPLCGRGQGMYAHYSLAMSLTGEPLGLLGLRVWSRSAQPKAKRHPRARTLDDDRESIRWHEAVDEVRERLEGKAQAIHVMDREADAFELLADLQENKQRFVIRVAHDRLLGKVDPDGDTHLYSAIAGTDTLLEREVQLSRRAAPRGGKSQRIHPTRSQRLAHLHVRAGSFQIARGRDLLLHLPDTLRLNFVEVVEAEPPAGQPPVHWRLVTTEPIETAAEVAAIVDYYRMRWLIEEFFKALKTGCCFEKLQLESARALLLALAIYSSVAWRLLLVRWMERHQPASPAAFAVTPIQLALLARNQKNIRRPWSDTPSCKDVLLAIAALGGHIPNNGAPGWLVLSRGFHTLLTMELGWHLSQDALGARCDQ